jgi:hypothetical protein
MIFVRFRGWGSAFVPLIPLACLGITAGVVDLATGDAHFFEDHRWPKAVAFLATAAVLWPIGRALNRERPGRGAEVTRAFGEITVHDEQLARILRSRHAVYGIPVEHWGIIIGFFGVVISLAP